MLLQQKWASHIRHKIDLFLKHALGIQALNSTKNDSKENPTLLNVWVRLPDVRAFW